MHSTFWRLHHQLEEISKKKTFYAFSLIWNIIFIWIMILETLFFWYFSGIGNSSSADYRWRCICFFGSRRWHEVSKRSSAGGFRYSWILPYSDCNAFDNINYSWSGERSESILLNFQLLMTVKWQIKRCRLTNKVRRNGKQ